MFNRLAVIAILSAGSVVALACDDDDNGMDTNDASVGTGGAQGGGGGRSGGGGTVSTGGASGTAGKGGAVGSGGASGSSGTAGSGGSADASTGGEAGPSDGGIDPAVVSSFNAASWIGLLDTVNTGEIAQGNIASTKASASNVKAFGTEMVMHHTEGLANDAATASALAVTPAPNSLTARLRAQSNALVTRLQTLTGSAFDRFYMEAQVKQHQAVLALLDTGIAANGGNADSAPPTMDAGRPKTLLALLVSTRAVVTEHLDMSKDILGSLP